MTDDREVRLRIPDIEREGWHLSRLGPESGVLVHIDSEHFITIERAILVSVDGRDAAVLCLYDNGEAYLSKRQVKTLLRPVGSDIRDSAQNLMQLAEERLSAT